MDLYFIVGSVDDGNGVVIMCVLESFYILDSSFDIWGWVECYMGIVLEEFVSV